MLDEDVDAMPPLSRAIFDNNIAVVESLISYKADINIPDAAGCTPLHYAVFYGRLELLKILLSQPAIEVDYKTRHGETPLLMAIMCHRGLAFVIPLIEAGADVNTESTAQEIALHVAIAYLHNDIANELLDWGADVNKHDDCNQSALHSAVEKRNYEGCCMLLFYGADVTIADHANMTPLMYAINDDVDEIAKVLINYYVDFSAISIFNETAFDLAVKFDKDYAIDLIEAGVDVNSSPAAIEYSVTCKSCAVFMKIWLQLNYDVLFELRKPFLCSYIEKCNFPQEEFVKFFYVLLDSPVAIQLVDHCVSCRPKFNLWGRLLDAFLVKKVNLNDRVGIVYTLLSLNCPVNYDDVALVAAISKFGEELKALINVYNIPMHFVNSLIYKDRIYIIQNLSSENE